MIRLVIFLGIWYVFTYSTCNKGSSCIRSEFNFSVSFTATPSYDSITLTDTVWFTLDESVVLKDYLSNNMITFSGASNLSFVFAIQKVQSASSVTPAADSFYYFIRKGSNINPLSPDKLREYKVAEEAGRYKLEVGFIPIKKGTFRILIENSANVYSKNFPCAKAGFGVMLSNPDQHIYLGYNIWGPGVYYFKVI
jgi:hypothetical protein